MPSTLIVMKNIAALFAIFLALTACASNAFREAQIRSSAIKNGMTYQDVVSILGRPATLSAPNYKEWSSGDIRKYTGTLHGAIRVYFDASGRVENVPEGGVISPAAASVVEAERIAAWERKQAWSQQTEQERLVAEKHKAELQAIKDAESAARAVEAAAEAKARKAETEKRFVELTAEERDVSTKAVYVCHTHAMCNKAFSLSQIFLTDAVDQKIQIATDAVIETYNPTEIGKVGAKVVKLPRAGESHVIRLSLGCKEGGGIEGANLCMSKKIRIYRQFAQYIPSLIVK
jgi:hypothetical protein